VSWTSNLQKVSPNLNSMLNNLLRVEGLVKSKDITFADAAVVNQTKNLIAGYTTHLQRIGSVGGKGFGTIDVLQPMEISQYAEPV